MNTVFIWTSDSKLRKPISMNSIHEQLFELFQNQINSGSASRLVVSRLTNTRFAKTYCISSKSFSRSTSQKCESLTHFQVFEFKLSTTCTTGKWWKNYQLNTTLYDFGKIILLNSHAKLVCPLAIKQDDSCSTDLNGRKIGCAIFRSF